MHPKRTISKKKHNRKTVQRKSKKQKPTMSQSQNVYVYTHKPRAQRKTQTHTKTTSQHSLPYHHVTVIPFQVPLPPEHPFNTNRPQNQSGVSASIPINNTTTATPAINPTPVAPQTPQSIAHTTPFVTPRGKRGKKLKYSDNPEGGESLPTIANEIDNLDAYAVDTLKAMAAKENVKAHIPVNIKKHKLVNLLKKHHLQNLKNI